MNLWWRTQEHSRRSASPATSRPAWTLCRPARTRPCTASPSATLRGKPAHNTRPAVNAKPAPKPNRRPNARPSPRTGSRSSCRPGLYRRDRYEAKCGTTSARSRSRLRADQLDPHHRRVWTVLLIGAGRRQPITMPLTWRVTGSDVIGHRPGAAVSAMTGFEVANVMTLAQADGGGHLAASTDPDRKTYRPLRSPKAMFQPASFVQ